MQCHLAHTGVSSQTLWYLGLFALDDLHSVSAGGYPVPQSFSVLVAPILSSQVTRPDTSAR